MVSIIIFWIIVLILNFVWFFLVNNPKVFYIKLSQFGISGISIFGLIFVEKNLSEYLKKRVLKHELIHFKQQKMFTPLLFIILYYFCYIFIFYGMIFKHEKFAEAYWRNPFEAKAGKVFY